MFSTRRNRKFSKVKFFSSLFLLVLILLVVFIHSDFFDVKKVVVKIDQQECVSEKDLQKSLNLLNQKIYLLNDGDIKTTLEKRYLCISKINLSKQFPTKVTIEITTRKPVAFLVRINKPQDLKLELHEASLSSEAAKLDFSITGFLSDTKFLVSENGFIFPDFHQNKQNIPTIYLVSSDINFYKNIPLDFFSKTVNIMKKLSEMSFIEVSFKIEGNKFLVDGRPRIVFSLTKDINYQFASLQLILQKAKIESKSMELIDLRFDKPIVVYSPKK